MSSPPVPVVSPPEPPPPQTLVCANCGAALAGEYCATCGQRHDPHVHTVAHFAGEAFESISHADSRLWRTIGYLLVKPGVLTREFFAGRRARYLPPFRLYLVVSVIFFVIAGLPGNDATQVSILDKQQARQAIEQAAAELEKTGEDTAEMRKAAKQGVVINTDGFEDFCKPFDGPDDGSSGKASRDNIRAFCDKMRGGDGAALGAALVHNLPRAMFLFLPLLAFVMRLLYWRPKRYYVEHLLFLVHNHAFVFVTFSIVALLVMIPWVAAAAGWVYFVALVYTAWYIYRAMRNVYQQRRAWTLSKYVVLTWAYLFTSLFVLLLTLIFTAIAG